MITTKSERIALENIGYAVMRICKENEISQARLAELWKLPLLQIQRIETGNMDLKEKL